MKIFHNFDLRMQTGGTTRVLKSNWIMLNKAQTDNHNLRKNVTTNEK